MASAIFWSSFTTEIIVISVRWKAFESLKKQLEAATLQAIDESQPFVVEWDVSQVALSATLIQAARPVAFKSQFPKERTTLCSSKERSNRDHRSY